METYLKGNIMEITIFYKNKNTDEYLYKKIFKFPFINLYVFKRIDYFYSVISGKYCFASLIRTLEDAKFYKILD
jgi:hypothetical protein